MTGTLDLFCLSNRSLPALRFKEALLHYSNFKHQAYVEEILATDLNRPEYYLAQIVWVTINTIVR